MTLFSRSIIACIVMGALFFCAGCQDNPPSIASSAIKLYDHANNTGAVNPSEMPGNNAGAKRSRAIAQGLKNQADQLDELIRSREWKHDEYLVDVQIMRDLSLKAYGLFSIVASKRDEDATYADRGKNYLEKGEIEAIYRKIWDLRANLE